MYLNPITIVLILILAMEWWILKGVILSGVHSAQYGVFALVIAITFAGLAIWLLSKKTYHKREPGKGFPILIKVILVIAVFFVLGHLIMSEAFRTVFQNSCHPEEIRSLYITVLILSGIVAIIRILF